MPTDNCVSFFTIDNVPKEINKNYASDKEIDELSNLKIDIDKDELHVIMLKCIAIDKIIPKKDFVGILTGNLHRFSAKWKFNLQSYELLVEEDSTEIEEIMNKLISDELIEITPENDLRITRKGIDYLG